jgi:hypothetical protein
VFGGFLIGLLWGININFATIRKMRSDTVPRMKLVLRKNPCM